MARPLAVSVLALVLMDPGAAGAEAAGAGPLDAIEPSGPRISVTHAGLQDILAEARPLSRLRLFAGRMGRQIGRRDTLYEFQGGASLVVLRGLRFTASYRARGYDLRGERRRVDVDRAGPYLGLSLRF